MVQVQNSPELNEIKELGVEIKKRRTPCEKLVTAITELRIAHKELEAAITELTVTCNKRRVACKQLRDENYVSISHWEFDKRE